MEGLGGQSVKGKSSGIERSGRGREGGRENTGQPLASPTQSRTELIAHVAGSVGVNVEDARAEAGVDLNRALARDENETRVLEHRLQKELKVVLNRLRPAQPPHALQSKRGRACVDGE